MGKEQTSILCGQCKGWRETINGQTCSHCNGVGWISMIKIERRDYDGNGHTSSH